ncbi:hypothetical protein DL93DRAFT_2156006 [Clavulina sp. PMI_390]|nr:hypothetical protein DL93DRAFT_2156006 [Clavulina sp. PMI_390]
MLAFLLPTGCRASRNIPPVVRKSSRRVLHDTTRRSLRTTTRNNDELQQTAQTNDPSTLSSVSAADTQPGPADASSSNSVPFAKSRRSSRKKNTPQLPRAPSLPTTELYLESIMAGSGEPTLHDLSAFRPARLTQETIESASYRSTYDAAISGMNRSFSRDQLVNLANEMIPNSVSHRMKKNAVMDYIMGKCWKLPHPTQVQKELRERTEIKKRVFPVSSAQLFSLLGQDGHLFKSLAATHHATLFVESNPSLAIRAEATRSNLKEFEEHMRALTKELITRRVELSGVHDFNEALIQSMSRKANAFIEKDGPSSLNITAISPEALATAERLANQAWIVGTGKPVVATHSAQEQYANSPPSYSMYPHAPEGALPWYLGYQATFRPRRVGEWLLGSKMAAISSLKGEGVFGLTNSATQPNDLKETVKILMNNLGGSTSSVKVTASTGHVLFTSTASSKLSTLLPTISSASSSWPMSSVTNWVEDGTQRATYIPSLPAPLIGVQLNNLAESIRLTYRRLADIASEGATSSTPQALVYNVPLNGAAPPQSGRWGKDESSFSQELVGNASIGPIHQIDLVLPDRPMDLQLRVDASRPLPLSSLPTELATFSNEIRTYSFPQTEHQTLTTAPLPPLRMTLDSTGEEFILERTQYVSKSVHNLPSPVSSFAAADAWPDLRDMLERRAGQEHPPSDTWSLGIATSKAQKLSCEVIVETVKDLESLDSYQTCSVQCNDFDNTEDWERFLLNCDVLTTHMYPTVPAGSKSPALTSPTAL